MNYMSSIIDKIIIERNKKVDGAILGEIQQIAIENGIETKIILNEKMVANALRKQIPQKPKGDYHSCPHYRCPNCYSSVKMYETDNTYPYCAFCGQSLNWHIESEPKND